MPNESRARSMGAEVKRLPTAPGRALISVVVPAFNEEGNVAALARRVADVMGPIGPWELLFVDDGSTDATLANIKALSADDPEIRYVSFTRNFGHQAALRAGLRHARGAAVILMDCDLEHPPELATSLVAAWREGAKVVAAQRNAGASSVSLFKRATSALFYRLLGALGDVEIEPGSADFLLIDRVVVDAINGFDSSDVFLRGLVRWLGYPIVKVPYDQGVRTAGRSKFNLRRMTALAVSGVVSHSLKPLRVAIVISAVFALLGVGLLVYSGVSFFWIKRTVVGWSSIMAAIALLGAGQFFVLGVIGEYLGRVLHETRRWPSYIVGETEDDGLEAHPRPSHDSALGG